MDAQMEEKRLENRLRWGCAESGLVFAFGPAVVSTGVTAKNHRIRVYNYIGIVLPQLIFEAICPGTQRNSGK